MSLPGRSVAETAHRVYRSYLHHSGPMMAAAIAFYAILSIVPILSLGVALLGVVLGSSAGALERIAGAIHDALPVSGDLVFKTLDQIRRSSGIASVVSLVGLLVPGSAIFGTMEAAFAQMRGNGPKRNWLVRRLLALILALTTLVLLLASVVITSIVAWLQASGPTASFLHGIPSRLIPVEAQAATLALSVLMFALIYRFLPNPPIPWPSAIRGAIFAGVAWELAKYLFSLYVRSLGHFNRIYGPLGAVVSLMVWALYSAVILLLGAELAADRDRAGASAENVSPGADPINRPEALSRRDELQ